MHVVIVPIDLITCVNLEILMKCNSFESRPCMQDAASMAAMNAMMGGGWGGFGGVNDGEEEEDKAEKQAIS